MRIASKWLGETFFENIFLPLHNPKPVTKPIFYEAWALKFAVSVSWRVLTFFTSEEQQNIDNFTTSQRQMANEAQERWRQFMLGEESSPSDYSQHLLPLDAVQDYRGFQISPFLNRYLLRSVHLDLISTESSAYVYTKMCRLILFGRIQEEHPNQWKGMQLRLRKGDIRPRDYHLPGGIMEYLNLAADESNRALESMSMKQQEVIEDMFEKKADEIADSEVFRAMKHDIAHSGDAAYSKRKRHTEDI